MNNILNNVKTNIIVIISVELLTTIAAFFVDYSGAGMAAIILKWIPAIVGLITLLLYFVSRLITKKYNWIITILGVILMVCAAISLHLTDYTIS